MNIAYRSHKEPYDNGYNIAEDLFEIIIAKLPAMVRREVAEKLLEGIKQGLSDCIYQDEEEGRFERGCNG